MLLLLIILSLLLSSNAYAELPSGNQFTIQAVLASGRPTLMDFGDRGLSTFRPE